MSGRALAVAIADEVAAEEAIGAGWALRDRMRAEGRDALLAVAPLSGDAIALGRWQRREDVLAEHARSRAIVRATGGPACVVGEGCVWMGLALERAGALVPTPDDRVLNRAVRGVLAGLRGAQIPAHYFGRDVVSVSGVAATGSSPVGLLGWTRDARGAVLFECVLGVRRPFALATDEDITAREEPAFMGKTPVALSAVRDGIVAGDVARALASGVCAWAERERETIAWQGAPLGSPERGELVWSAPRAIPIGVASAGARLTADGAIADVTLSGDFYQDEAAPGALRERLVGRRAERDDVGRALDAVYGRPGVIEGTRSLQPLWDAVMESITLASRDRT